MQDRDEADSVRGDGERQSELLQLVAEEVLEDC